MTCAPNDGLVLWEVFRANDSHVCVCICLCVCTCGRMHVLKHVHEATEWERWLTAWDLNCSCKEAMRWPPGLHLIHTLLGSLVLCAEIQPDLQTAGFLSSTTCLSAKTPGSLSPVCCLSVSLPFYFLHPSFNFSDLLAYTSYARIIGMCFHAWLCLIFEHLCFS